jgi:hypothetical protein
MDSWFWYCKRCSEQGTTYFMPDLCPNCDAKYPQIEKEMLEEQKPIKKRKKVLENDFDK